MKKLSLFLVFILSVSLLAACNSGSSGSGSGSSGSGGDSGGAVASGDSVHLVYWSMWNNTEAQATVLEQGIRDFEAKNPGVTVEINWAGREIRQTLSPAIDNGTVIDIFDEDTERVYSMWGNYILNLTSYYDNTYPTTGGAAYKNSAMSALQELSRSLSPDGGLYTVGYQPFAFIFMYNTSHFADAGIASTPKTWDEFLDACAKLKAAGHTPLTSDNEYISGLFGYHLSRLKGVDFGNELVTNGGSLWDDPAVLEAARAIETLASNGYFDRNTEGNIWPAGQQDIALGNVTMYLNGSWLVNEIMGSTGPDFPWGQFNYPGVPGGGGVGIEAANFGSQAFAINKNCANPDVAFALLAHLTSGEWDAKLAQESFGIPVGGSTDWPVQLADAKAVFNSLTTVMPWVGGVENDTDVGPIVRQNVQKLAGGTITAEQFVENCKAGN